jgi:hypothetical protein
VRDVQLRSLQIGAFTAVVLLAASRLHSNDFWSYYWAATQAHTQPSAVYASIPFDAFGRAVPPFVYAPPAILLLRPLAWFQPDTAAWLLFATSVILAGVSALVVLPRLMSSLGVRASLAALLVVSTFLNYPFYATLILGQINIIVGSLLLAFYVLHRRSHIVGSSACLALAIVLKIFPAIFLVPLVFRRRFGEVVTVLSIVMLMTGATMMLFPWRLWTDWLAFVAHPSGFAPAGLAADVLAYNVSISGTLRRMLGASALITSIAAISGAAMLALSLRWQPARVVLSPLEAASVALIMFCAAPISWGHHLAMAIPLVAVALPACSMTAVCALAYAALCFKWDWPWGSMMVAGMSPATAAAMVLWLLMVSARRSPS